MNAFSIVYLLALHFLADFVLQTRDMAKNKSSDLKVLAAHVGIQFAVVALGATLIAKSTVAAIALGLLNGAIHGAVDWYIWKLYKLSVQKRFPDAKPETYKFWEDHLFFTTIGLDQLLHGATLVLLGSLFI